ncbi:hypothetical protein BGZ58_003345 [Dissophora ornata]|nr:hypothetical protein BGZ58_003345 [Dissophora ornata]
MPSSSNPKILIIGAGIGGVTLALLLEKASIDYEIYERARELKALGSGIGIAPNVMPMLEQLGIREDLRNIWQLFKQMDVYSEAPDGQSLEIESRTEFTELEELSGYPSISMARPEFHAILLSHVPAHKIHFGKRVLSILQDDDNGVLIRTSDGMTHEGDILVGADGAYSGVRQSLYKQMASEKLLPSSDAEDLKICHMSILGTTNPIDPTLIPYAEDGFSRCCVVMGHNKPHSWRYFEVLGNRFCWRVDVQLQSKSFVQSDAFRSTDWGTASSSSIEDDWRAFKVPLGVDGGYVTIGDLVDATPKENVTKVMLEEKLYTTWYHRRTVLLGDGAVNAMLDAIILANAIYEIALDATPENIQVAFKEYYSERFPHAKADLEASQKMAKIHAGQTWTDSLRRKVVFKFMPASLMRNYFTRTLAYRPQASFLPKVECRGSVKADPQKKSKRYARENSTV